MKTKSSVYSFFLGTLLTLLGELVLAEIPPNIILIISDDQRHDDLDGRMPNVEERIMQAGVRFMNAYVTTPACCPSRASILTGMYASRHRVTRNSSTLEQATIVNHLKEAGYYTGLVGKYLNTWDGSPRPEFDYWASFPGGSAPFYNPVLNVNGKWIDAKGYITDLFEDCLLEFLARATKQSKPFFLYFAPNAPHSPATPETSTVEMYNNVGLPKVPSLFESDRSDKPTWLRKIPAFKGGRRKKLLTFRRNQLRTLWSLDRTIGSLLDQLHISDLIDQTLIFYISDNGVFLGEHGLGSKAAVYEEAVKVPFGVYLKGVFEGGGVNREHLVANIDIAPTIYDLVGIAPKVKPDGLSLRPLSQGRTSWRKGLLLESWRGSESRTPFVAYHTADSVYVKNSGERSEFYDLIVDPHQLDNRIDDPKLASKLSSLEKDLNATLMRVRGSVSFDVPQAARGKTKFERKKLRAKAAQVAESP